MDKPFKDPDHGIAVINVAIGHLAEMTNDCNALIKKLKMIRTVLHTVKDGSWRKLEDDGVEHLQPLYDAVIRRASEKTGKHVNVFEHESRREDFKDVFDEED